MLSYKDICQESDPLRDCLRSDSDMESLDFSDEEDEAMTGEADLPEDSKMVKLLRPRVTITKDERREACKPWRKSIIVKLLGRRLSLRYLRTRLNKLWKLAGLMDFIDLENDYFIIQFSKWDDYRHVFLWRSLDDNGPLSSCATMTTKVLSLQA